MSILESEWFRKLIKFGILSLFLFGPASTFASASESCPSESELVGNICVTDLSDPEGEVAEIDPSNPNQSITLRMAVTAINESAAATSPTSSIYFDAALFNSNTSESTIALSSSLEIKSNIRIIAPIAADSSILLTITRSENMETNVALIVVNPDSPAAIIDSDFANREIIIENVKINSAANSESISTTSGRAIEVRQSDSPTSEISSGPTLELRNVVIENSVSQEGGGAITSSADVTIENSILKNNISIGSGGAISAMETVTVIDSNFESNTAVRPAGSNPATENGPEGGAIYSEGKVVSSNTIFSTNVAEIGGAISARSVEINQSVFISNQANLVVDGDASWFGMGGAIALKGAGEENLIEDSEFALNSAGSGGALVVNTPAEFPAITNLVISATTFSSNVASADPDFALGGALLVPFEVSVEIKDETLFIENSSAGSGGAIAVQGGFRPKGDENLESGLTISNSSFVSNIATNDGGAIHVSSITPSNLNISYDVSISTMPFNNLVEVEAEHVTPTTFAGNSAGFYGGAIFMSSLSGEAKISEVSFIENHAEDGGALYIEHPNFNFGYFEFDLGEIDPLDFVNSWQESSTVVESSTFSENSASGVGGAIYAEDEVVIHESQFLENMAAEYGGAIAAQRVEIDKSFFTSNYACAEIEFDEEDDGYRCVQPPASDSEQNQFNGNGGAIALEMRYNEDFADVFFNVFTNPDFDSDIPQGIAALLEESINVPSIITSSIFEENEAGSEGGAVWGYAWLFFNSLLNNRAEVGSAVSLQDFQYDLVNQQMYLAPNNLISQLVGNFFTADSAEGSLCSIPFHLSFFNQVSDSSCTLLEEEVISTLEETFGLTVDISSIDFNPEDFPEGKLPDSILSSDSVARFEEIFREDLDTFIIGSGPVSNEFLGTSPGLNISIGSLIIDIESVLINGNLAGPEFIYLDSSRLNSLMDSIFGRGEETVGIKRDISGAVRPSDGCWTFGAFQFAEAFDCLAVPEGSLVQNPEAAKIPDSQFRGAGSSWKPRVPTERDLARRARLAALKLKIAAIKLERERRKSSIGKAQALPLKKPLGSKSAKKMDLRFAMH